MDSKKIAMGVGLLSVGALCGYAFANQNTRSQPKTSKPKTSKPKTSKNGLLSFPFKVKGQEGKIPRVGLGTANLFGEECIKAVRAAIRAGYRHIDTALLYDNQEAVGIAVKQAIDAGEVKREDLWITSKVAFYPSAADGTNCWMPLSYYACNKKGRALTTEAIDLCLKKLQMDYVDLMLIHNPLTELPEYRASCCPHYFELEDNDLTAEERVTVMQNRLSKVNLDMKKARETRADTWKALEAAHKAGKCRNIGVSNYATELVREMKEYATVMPCVNQLELHPRFSSPSLQALAKDMGMVLTAYGSGNSARISRHGASKVHDVVQGIATRLGISRIAVVLRWTLARQIVVIPRTATTAHIVENLEQGDQTLSDADLAVLDQLNEDHCYYWSPLPSLAPEVD